MRGSLPLKFAFVPLALLAASLTCGGDKLTLPDEGNPAALELLSGRGQTGTVGQPLPDSLSVRVTDSKDRPVSGQTVVFALTGTARGDVIPDTATTDDSGIASSRWVLGTTAGAQTVQARVVGFSLTLDFSAQAVPDAPASVMLVSGEGQSGVVGAMLADSLVVRVEDSFGNGVPGVTVAWSVTGGGSVSAASTVTGANGQTGVERTLGSNSGPQSTTATVAGTGSVTFAHQAGSGSATDLLLVSGDNQTGPAGFPAGAPLVVKLVDGNGNGVPGVSVTWVIATGGGSVIPTTSVTDTGGFASTNWTLGPTAGSNTLNATAAGFIVGFSATGTAAVPTQISANSPTTQTGTAGQAAPQDPSVRVSDANDNPVQGVGVTFQVTQGGGSVSDTTVGTNAGGIATLPTWTLGPAAGTNQLQASVAGLQGSPVTFTATGNPGAPASLLITTQPPASVQSGAAFSVAPVIQLLDGTGNPSPTSGVNVTVSVNGGGATLNGTLTRTTNSSGVATFGGLSLAGPSGTYNLNFDASGLPGVTSSSITLAAGSPTQLSIMTQPSATATSGQPFVQQPVIEIQDAAGNVVASPPFAVTAAIASGGGTLGGTVTVNSVNGVAAFTNLKITGSSGSRTLSFSASGLTGMTSGTITLGAGSATQIAINGGNNGSAPAGSAVSPTPSVIVRDAQNNPVAGVAVTFQIATGGGSLSGGSPQVVVTNSSGIAQAGTWTLGPIAGTNTLTATATGLTGSPLTFTATATVGAAANITKSGGDNLTGPISTTLGTPHEVLVTDANGNGVPGVQVNWSESDNGSVAPSQSTTDSAGHATATRTLGSSAGAQTTTATVPGVGSVTFNITATVGGASQLDLAGGDNQTATAGSTLPQPLQVLVRDAGNNPVSGVTITWTVLSGGGSVTASSTSNASGIATATWTLGQTITGGGVQTVRASGPGSSVNFVATATPGPVTAGNSSVVLSPSTITASSGSSASTVTVTARDQYNNAVSGATVVLSASGSGNTITQPGATGSGGSTTGTISSTVAQSETVSATINGTLVTQSPTLTVNPSSASRLSILAQPGGTVTAGQAITPSPSFEILDAFGNRVTSATNGVTATIGTNPAGGTLGGTTTVNASGGVATFNSLTLDNAGNGYTLVAMATGLTSSSPTSAINVTAGGVSAAQSTVTASPATITASTGSSTSTVTVTARDAFGNPVPGVAVTISSTGAPNFASGTSNGAGVYSASFFSNTAGQETITAVAGGVTLSASPTVTVNPAAADPTVSTASVTPASVNAGNPVSITVQARDQFGNNLNTGGASVVVQVTGANTATPGVTDMGDGTYTASYTPTAAGTDNVAITLNGTPVSGSPFTVSVSAGAADAGNSTATVPNGTAGAPTTVTVQSRDASGNILTTGGATVSVTVTGANSAGPAAATDNSDGTYTFQYTPTAAGTDNVAITLNGTAIGGSPYTSAVAAGAADPASSTASITPSSVTAGNPVSIVVQARDQFGNIVSIGGETVVVQVTGANTATPAVTDVGDGTYTASYTPTATGNDAIAITMNGTPISGSPFTQPVSTGPANGSQSSAVVPGAGSAGSPVLIDITTRDQFGNLLTTGGATVNVNITGANPMAAVVTDNNDGTYDARYTPAATGTDNAGVTVNGTSVPGNPFAIVISAGGPSPPNSSASVPPGTAGAPTGITVQVRDASNNPLTTGGDNVAISVSGANSAGPITATDNNDGTYSAAYTPTAAGTDNVAITLNGTAIGGSPYTSVVSAGGVSASQSTITASPGMITASTGSSASTITVTVRDGFGNPLSGVNVSLSASGTGNTVSAAGPTNASGIYAGTVSSTTAEAKTVSATAGGTLITQTATVTVAAGAADGAQSSAAVPSSGSAGSPVLMDITTRDQFGNLLTAGGATVNVNITGANPGAAAVTDNNDGTYDAQFTPTASGTDNATITVNGANVPGSPFVITISAGGPSPPNSSATVPPGTAGAPTSITVQVRDASNNPLTTGGDNVAISVSGANSAGPITAADNNDGTYSAAYTPTVAGTDNIAITLNGTAISGSPYPSVVSAGGVSASQSTITASPGAITASTGSSASTITVTVRDGFGNPLGGVNVVLSATGTGNAVSAAGLTDAAGVYAGTVSSTVAEAKTVSATAGGTLITQTASVVVSHAAPSQLSVATQPGATVTAGQAISPAPAFSILDQFDNLVSSAANSVTAMIGNNPAGGTLGGTPAVNAVNGVATFSNLTLDKAGTGYTLIGTATGLTSSPATSGIDVTPAGVSASQSTVSALPASITASSGSSASTITVTVQDGFGNPLSGVNVVLSATGTGNAVSAAGLTDAAGVYTGTLSSTVAELKTVSATAGGTLITQAASVTVGAGAADPAQTTANVPGGVAGSQTTITITSRDAFGNALTTGGATVTVTVGGTNAGAAVTLTDNNDGTYTAVYTPATAGSDTIDITLNAVAIQGSPYTSVVL